MLIEFYPAIKATHISLALLSVGLFTLRGIGVQLGIRAARARLVRRASVVIDTALLGAALLLLAARNINPFAVTWLQVKLALLIAYILFGILALRAARTRGGKLAAFIVALSCFGMMFSVARTHDPAGFLSVFWAG